MLRSKLGRVAGAAALVVTLGFAGTALGQSKKDQAESHYEQGKAYYRTGAYELAIQEFLEGYKLDPRAGVLFNIARGYEELKDRPKAIEYYKKYLDLGAQATAAVEARARLAGLERAIKEDEDRKKAEAAERERQQQLQQQAQQQAQAMPPPVATTPGATGAAPPAGGAIASGTTGAEASVSANASTPADPELARTLKLSGIIAGGAGVLLAGAGGFFVWRGSQIKSEIETEIAKGAWSSDLTSKDADMKSANTYALIGFIAGGVAIAGGAVLYYIGWTKSPREGGSTAMLSPVFGPNGTSGLALTGRF